MTVLYIPTYMYKNLLILLAICSGGLSRNNFRAIATAIFNLTNTKYIRRCAHTLNMWVSQPVRVNVFVDWVLLKRYLLRQRHEVCASPKIFDVKCKYFNCFSNYLLIRLLSRPMIYEYLLCVQISDTYYTLDMKLPSVRQYHFKLIVDFSSISSPSKRVVLIMANAGTDGHGKNILKPLRRLRWSGEATTSNFIIKFKAITAV